MEISNLLEAEFKALVIRMLKELIGYFNSVKKTQAEMKVYIKCNKIYRESRVEWMKQRIKSMIWNIRKKKTFSQSSKKNRESKKK